ncbi:unnamed protein product [Timema podura]|uniref:Peptidase M14 domain-containing protein n=1 Tax=Timema podura TaxID=61482 RepID=A0ABN7NZ21_TIMPD|nr:unnamed protein product [Timema podura]
MGFDLNRTWHQISRWAHPTLHAVHTMLTELDQIKDVELDFVLDLHAHSSLLGVFVYGNTYDDVYSTASSSAGHDGLSHATSSHRHVINYSLFAPLTLPLLDSCQSLPSL